MRFNFGGILLALAATTQFATANPAPAKWNGKGAEAGYKFGAVACAAGALVCNSQGMTVGAYTLGSAAFCCSTAGAAVTASQSDGWKKAWTAAANKLGDAARMAKGGVSKVGKLAAECSDKVCRLMPGKKQPTLPRRATIDGPKPKRSRHGRKKHSQKHSQKQSDDEGQGERRARRSVTYQRRARRDLDDEYDYYY
ncbi:hypothetical protein V2G26_012457 [Clonostachys chloroleuca]|uniref:Uncharacterized protein n=1 Tax=Clonostachys chloroleuca TaxID=1926264 RepID=A0AA35Q702_9HYPO|nr:unnamed protein product [Clonostachys chloroleuca]